MYKEEIKYQRAKERVETLRGFYIHLTVYVIVNLFLFLLNIFVSPDTLWFYWPLLGWGIAIVLHAVSVFGSGRMSSANWEEKKIREIMEEYDDTNTSS
ncbi:MAG: 2TM domain-containing protein [Candidatus Promineifilaceae bacterium]|nr:2TM domain-containing protein [Candidatus Promineifilaceae bacterium]